MPLEKKNVTIRTLGHYWSIYLLLLPTLALVGIFSYSPALSGIYHSFFVWNGSWIKEFCGLDNYINALSDETFIGSFRVLGIMIVANLFKMIPAIATAVCIHRMVSDRWQYYYRVIFVVPMIIPIWVNLLLWVFFYNPQIGPLNIILRNTGGMSVLNFLDNPSHGLPALSSHLMPVHTYLVDNIFGAVWGVFFFGFVLLLVAQGVSGSDRKWFAWLVLAGVTFWALFPFGDPTAAAIGRFAIHAAVIFGGAIAIAEFFRNRLHYPRGILKWAGGLAIALGLAALLGSHFIDNALVARESIDARPVGAVVTALFGSPWGLLLLGSVLFGMAPGVARNSLSIAPVAVIGIFAAAMLVATPYLNQPETADSLAAESVAVNPVEAAQPATDTQAGSAMEDTFEKPASIWARIPSVKPIWSGWVYLVLLAGGGFAFASYIRNKAEMTGPEFIRMLALMTLIGAGLLVMATLVWADPIGQFDAGRPAWLGSQKLVLPSIIMYGFPWVGVFGVLVYLAGLQNISQDVYEAADLDGIGWFRKFTLIEFPLILTQIRLMLILMTINVIRQYMIILVMVGPEGGPGGAAQVPGLYMFLQGFRYGFAGYGTAIGVILFILILALTLINQKFVRVDK